MQWRFWRPPLVRRPAGGHCVLEYQALHGGTLSWCLLQGCQLCRLDPKEPNNIGLGSQKQPNEPRKLFISLPLCTRASCANPVAKTCYRPVLIVGCRAQ